MLRPWFTYSLPTLILGFTNIFVKSEYWTPKRNDAFSNAKKIKLRMSSKPLIFSVLLKDEKGSWDLPFTVFRHGFKSTWMSE